MKKQCWTCLYFRDGAWCSNSKSTYYRLPVLEIEKCPEFTRRGQQAPLTIKLAIATMKKIRKAKKGK